MELPSYIPPYLLHHLSLQQNRVYCFFVPHFFDILSSIVEIGCSKGHLLIAASHVDFIDAAIHCMLFNPEIVSVYSVNTCYCCILCASLINHSGH